MTTAPGKKHYAARDFKDAGTGRSFTAGDVVDAQSGELDNYEAAGLVTDKRPDPAKSAEA